MFLKLRKKIEANRNSQSIFWRTLVLAKDFTWNLSRLVLDFFYFPRKWIFSFFKSRIDKQYFGNVKTYCMFIGYSRSGHSIIGSILDAHLNIVIGHELDALKFVGKGFSKNQIFSLLLDSSKQFTKNKRIWEGYSYLVPNQWHSTFDQLLVIGDKKGQSTVRRLKQDFKTFDKLQAKLKNIDIKFIHVYRNPYDNIATISRKRDDSLPEAIGYYFSLVEVMLNIKRQVPRRQILDLKQESFIADPKKAIGQICEFLGVEATPAYLEAAAKIVWQRPHQSRYNINWTSESVREVRDRISEVDFLKDYSYDQ